MKRKIQFYNDHIYHVFNRGVEKRDIFLDDQDHYRFIHNLFEMNDENPVTNSRYYFDPEILNREAGPIRKKGDPRKRLVDIFVFTLMPNHYHLLLRQKKSNGITRFIQKVCTGYTMYFNQKYQRVGGLFQGRFKAVMVDQQEHFYYLPHYIHINPLSLMEKGQPSGQKARLKSLINYRWNSFSDYVGVKNFPSVTKRNFILSVFGGEERYKEHIANYLKEVGQKEWTDDLQEVILD
jgi:putative transposase